MKQALLAGLILLWAAGTGNNAGAETRDLIEETGEGSINWSQGVLAAKGAAPLPREAKNIAQARLMAERAALADARRNLWEALLRVRVEGNSRIEDYVAKSAEIRLQAEAAAQGAAEVKNLRRFLPDGIEVTAGLNLRGKLLGLFLAAWGSPRPQGGAESKEPERPEEGRNLDRVPRPPLEQPAGAEGRSPPGADLPAYTGLVIDGRHISLVPALAPRILDEYGRELYGGAYASREKALTGGAASYTRDLKAARMHPRAGKNPLNVKALSVNPSNPSEIILSGEETQKILPFARPGTFLAECNVIIVVP